MPSLHFPFFNYLRESVKASRTSHNSKPFFLTRSTPKFTLVTASLALQVTDAVQLADVDWIQPDTRSNVRPGKACRCTQLGKGSVFYFSHFPFYILPGPGQAIMERLPPPPPSHDSALFTIHFYLPAFQILLPGA